MDANTEPLPAQPRFVSLIELRSFATKPAPNVWGVAKRQVTAVRGGERPVKRFLKEIALGNAAKLHKAQRRLAAAPPTRHAQRQKPPAFTLEARKSLN